MRLSFWLVAASLAATLGASRAEATTIFTAEMIGLNEVPPNASNATGFGTVTVDGNTLTVQIDWENLEGGLPGAAHIHCCTAPGTNVNVAVGFPDFPMLNSGSYFRLFDLLDPNIYTASFLNDFGGGTAAGAQAALIAGLEDHMAYTNIHNETYQGGEIRGNLSEVPEPTSMVLLASGLALGFRQSRRPRSARQ